VSARGDRRAVVVTGLGAVTPLGMGVEATWAGLLAGRRVARTIERFAVDGFPTRFAAMVDPALPSAGTGAAPGAPGAEPEAASVPGSAASVHTGTPTWRELELALGDRWIPRLARAAAREAMAAAGLAEAPGPGEAGRRGLLLASGLGLHTHAEVMAPCVAAGAGSAGGASIVVGLAAPGGARAGTSLEQAASEEPVAPRGDPGQQRAAPLGAAPQGEAAPVGGGGWAGSAPAAAALAATTASGWEDLDLPAFLAAAAAATAPGLASRQTPGGLAGLLAGELGLAGPLGTVQTACAAGTQALGDAARWIRCGLADLVLVVGADSEIYPLGLASFCLVGALSRRNGDPQAASRPFARDRDGFVLGEGAAAMVLESAESARRRGAPVLARLAGFGSAADAYRATDPHPEGDGALLAMRRALATAGVGPHDVGHVNAHATSTLAGDVAEARALTRLFGGALDAVSVSASKSMLGHLTTAAGVIEAVVTVRALGEGRFHPTANLGVGEVDPQCALDHVVGEPRRAAVGFALSNGFAFGGQCASVLLAHPDA
jgi:3-oxoacyl-(acyl-carrier-protein) synthase